MLFNQFHFFRALKIKNIENVVKNLQKLLLITDSKRFIVTTVFLSFLFTSCSFAWLWEILNRCYLSGNLRGQKIPKVKYTKNEIKAWNAVYDALVNNTLPKHACKEYRQVFPLFQKHCGFQHDNIPQLQDISDYLKGR